MDTNYPIILWPTKKGDIAPWQLDRSDIHGFSDDFFSNKLNDSELKPLLRDDIRLEVPCRAILFEPAVALVDENAGVFIDVEIDAPYHGW